LNGTDSKSGTLVHEMSHFDVVAGTDDWAYGQTRQQELSRTNPRKR
jgi:peptidyl-Lys metalloendopeptidase